MIISIALLILFFLIVLIIYNSLISKKNEVENSFAGIEVQLTKRYDLIPNLISSVKQYMEHERTILEKITMLRTQALDKKTDTNKKIQIDNELSSHLGKIIVAVENYPDLKASENFNTLMLSLNEVEGQLSAARRSFNAAVTDYNNAIEMLPSSIIATLMSYKKRELFVAPEHKRQDINVSNLFNS